MDTIIATDLTWRTARFTADTHNKQLNVLQTSLTALYKAKPVDKTKVEALLSEKAALVEEGKRLELVAKDIEDGLNKMIMGMGNIVHESVKIGMDERDNEIIKFYWPNGRSEADEILKRKNLLGKDGKGVPGLYSHHEVLTKIEGLQ